MKWFFLRPCFFLFSIIICSIGIQQHCAAAPFKVLVVMSYEKDYAWCQQIKKGIESELGDTADIRYFYMDTKKDSEQGAQKAAEAYKLYEEFKPDGVIAADDNAQSMFVVPYLKDKVTTPVIFCGVNAEPEKYGYPASNVSGILERDQIRESIVFLQELIPSVKKISFMMKDSSTGNAVKEYVEKEMNTYPAAVEKFYVPKTFEQAVTMAEEAKGTSDALFFETMEQLPTQDGTLLPERQAIARIATVYGKPTITGYEERLKGGAVCAVVKAGEEQGATAAQMLRKAMEGTPVSEIPITQNHYGRRIINIEAMDKFKIKPSPQTVRSAGFIHTEEWHSDSGEREGMV